MSGVVRCAGVHGCKSLIRPADTKSLYCGFCRRIARLDPEFVNRRITDPERTT